MIDRKKSCGRIKKKWEEKIINDMSKLHPLKT